MLDNVTKERIVNEETAKFLDEGFAPLDLGGFPSLQKPITEEFATEDRHGLSRVDINGLGGINRLKQLIQSPDLEALTQLATENPEIAKQLQSDLATGVAKEFTRRHPDYVVSTYNYKRILSFLLDKHLKQRLDTFDDSEDAVIALQSAGGWTLAEVESAYRQLLHDGELETPRNAPRFLNESQKQQCAAIAGNGDILGAIALYVEHRLNEDAADEIRFELVDPLSFTSNPEYRPIFREALAFCWANYRQDFSPTPERWKFIWNYIGDRFATVKLMDIAWESCKLAEKDQSRSTLLLGIEQHSEIDQVDGFDSLSDEEIARLKAATLRQYAQQQQRRR